MPVGLDAVLSEDALSLHKDYLKNLKLKYSVFEKSLPEISGKNIKEISRMRIKEREELLSLIRNIKAHELYFSSFGREFQRSNAVRDKYRSEASFLYELYEAAMRARGNFIFVSFNNGRLDYEVDSEYSFIRSEPLLAIDLCEHAYFMDFAFGKDEYLVSIISRLNLNSLDRILSKRD